MKKTLAIMFTSIGLMCAGLASCGNQTHYDFTIGVSQFVTDDALDNATRGFIDRVKEGMAKAGKTVDIEVQNAALNTSTAASIASSFASKKKSLILANATPCVLACYNAITDIPIVGTSVTEYNTPLNKDDISGGTGVNVTGTSDFVPADRQAAEMVAVFPSANHYGLLYCTNESNSLYQIQKIEAELTKLGKTSERISFATSNDVSTVLNGKIDSIDALYIPTDNTCAHAAETINGICENKNKPVFAGEEGICKGCGAITLTISYYELGKISGDMALEILLEGKDIKTMPIRYAENMIKKYNPTICQRLGITPPEGYVAIQ